MQMRVMLWLRGMLFVSGIHLNTTVWPTTELAAPTPPTVVLVAVLKALELASHAGLHASKPPVAVSAVAGALVLLAVHAVAVAGALAVHAVAA